MRFNSLIRRAIAFGSGLALLAMGPASGAMAQTAPSSSPPPCPNGIPVAGCTPPSLVGGLPTAPIATKLTVNVSDTGFDQPSYTASGQGWPSSNQVEVTFTNTGTKTHSATAQPGTTSPAQFIRSLDANGNILLQCFQNGASSKCGKLGSLDTGGIAPGQSVVMSLSQGSGGLGQGGVYTFSSAPDCLNGNKNPAFNCTPSTITVKAVFSPSAVLGSSFVYGSVFGTPDNKDCQIGTIIKFPSGVSRCQLPYRTHQTAQGTSKNPIQNLTINIDDINGFTPTYSWVAMGGTITWTNTGKLPHSLKNVYPVAPIPGSPFLGDGPGPIMPGQSYTWNVPGAIVNPSAPNAGLTVASASEFLQSVTNEDIIPPSQTGFFGASAGVCLGAGGNNCGVSGMNSIVTLVAPPS